MSDDTRTATRENPYDEVPRVRRSSSFGWEWNVGHVCTYACGAGGCVGAGWRPTRRWAIRAAHRYMRGLLRRRLRTEGGWETVRNGSEDA